MESRSTAPPRIAAGLVVAATLLLAGWPAAGRGLPDEIDRNLGPARDLTVVTFPLQTVLTGACSQPALSVQLRAHVGLRVALTVRAIGVWYAAGSLDERAHGGGVGGAVGFHYYTERALAGPFVGLEGGDVEAFVGGRRGRSAGGTFVFGYALVSERSSIAWSFGLGIGYWHRMGALESGMALPEILALRLGVGWAGPRGP